MGPGGEQCPDQILPNPRACSAPSLPNGAADRGQSQPDADIAGDSQMIMSQIRILLQVGTNHSALQAVVSLMADSRTLRSCQDQLSRCKADLAVKCSDYDQALDKISMLESRVARGETNPLTTKVLRLRRNPKDDPFPAGRRHEVAVQTDADQQCVQLTLEIEQLRSQVDTWKKRRDTLQTVFSKQTEQFRDDCLQLLGFKIEYLAQSHEYRLRSIFSPDNLGDDDDDDHGCFLFRRKRDGRMQILHTSTSIPVFLSQANLYLWRLTMDHHQ